MESPFGVLTMLRSYDKFCLDLYRRPDLVARTVETFTEEIAFPQMKKLVDTLSKEGILTILHLEG